MPVFKFHKYPWKLCELRVFPLRSSRLGFNAFTAEYAEIKTRSAQRKEDWQKWWTSKNTQNMCIWGRTPTIDWGNFKIALRRSSVLNEFFHFRQITTSSPAPIWFPVEIRVLWGQAPTFNYGAMMKFKISGSVSRNWPTFLIFFGVWHHIHYIIHSYIGWLLP